MKYIYQVFVNATKCPILFQLTEMELLFWSCGEAAERIEAQGKYLQAILEKAQKSLSQNLSDDSNGDLKATGAHLTGFHSTIYSLVENLNAEDKEDKHHWFERYQYEGKWSGYAYSGTGTGN